MRKNTREVFDAWYMGSAHHGAEAIWTDGQNIYSYQTILVQREGREILVNVTNYSQTTTTHQNAIRFMFNQRSMIPFDFFDDVPKGRKTLT